MRMIATNLVLASTTVLTPSTESVHFPASNLKDPVRSKSWRSTTKDDTLVVDFGSAMNVDSVVMLFPRINALGFSGSQTIKIQANATDVWTSPSVDVTLTLTSKYFMASHYFTSNQSYRYWRVVLTDASNTNSYMELGTLILGTHETIPNAQNGFGLKKNDGTKTQVNDFGVPFSDLYPKLQEFSLNYVTLTISEVELLEDMYDRNGSSVPVFFVIDETDALFDKDTYSVYGLMKKSFDLTHKNYNILDSNGLTITEIN